MVSEKDAVKDRRVKKVIPTNKKQETDKESFIKEEDPSLPQKQIDFQSLYLKSLEVEKKEVEQRTENEDRRVFVGTCHAIQKCINEILELKTQKLSNARVHSLRDITSEARQNVDTVTLQLQNLLYEISHLKKETRRCLDFKSADIEIDLVPLDQFYREAPESISRAEETMEDPHQQRLAQLHWELEQRRGQTKLSDKLILEKQTLEAIIFEQEKKLSLIAPRINAILEATKPLQEALNLPVYVKREEHKVSTFLPIPLYTVWTQESVRSHSSSRCKKVDKEEKNDFKYIVNIHPLQVQFSITCKGGFITFMFYYSQLLKVVSATVTVNCDATSSVLVNVLDGESILDCLFSGNDGEFKPSTAVLFLLQKYQINFLDFIKKFGKPYQWMQSLAGLNYLHEDDSPFSSIVTSEKKLSADVEKLVTAQYMPNILLAVRRRLKARIALNLQLITLESAALSGNVSITIPVEIGCQYFPGKLAAELKKWSPVTWEDFCELTSFTDFIEQGFIHKNCLFFQATFERKCVKLNAMIIVFPNYPETVPFISLNMEWDRKKYTSKEQHIRHMEIEVNMHWEEMASSKIERQYILSLMLLRTAMCLDIYTETSSFQRNMQGLPNEFHKEKIFFRPARGRDRSCPYKYLSKLGVFSQR